MCYAMGNPPSWIVAHGPHDSVPSCIVALTRYYSMTTLKKSKLRCNLVMIAHVKQQTQVSSALHGLIDAIVHGYAEGRRS